MKKLRIVFKYIKQILKHKYVVFQECKKCGIIWQGITHDLSKFSKDELLPSALYYQNDKDSVKTEEIEKQYQKAWLHHKGCNKHHWEYWVDFDDNGMIIARKIPYKYVVEMVCDWIGAGKVYNEGNWTTSSPLEYYTKVREGRHFNFETEDVIIGFLNCIKYHGLDEFYKMAKSEFKSKYPFLKYYYDHI